MNTIKNIIICFTLIITSVYIILIAESYILKNRYEIKLIEKQCRSFDIDYDNYRGFTEEYRINEEEFYGK